MHEELAASIVRSSYMRMVVDPENPLTEESEDIKAHEADNFGKRGTSVPKPPSGVSE